VDHRQRYERDRNVKPELTDGSEIYILLFIITNLIAQEVTRCQRRLFRTRRNTIPPATSRSHPLCHPLLAALVITAGNETSSKLRTNKRRTRLGNKKGNHRRSERDGNDDPGNRRRRDLYIYVYHNQFYIHVATAARAHWRDISQQRRNNSKKSQIARQCTSTRCREDHGTCRMRSWIGSQKN